ncbi:hypothetical protein BSZ18_04805 [Bradyrhizobium canariense]|uniref:Uncharacterized protein n=1 Tax=Bradyrhizobium canariense TaxID=255045 RepID=A0A1X3HDV7_9BRAD|nr:hypothetical protein BSZ25_15735 [Bradyrhizobium canariense]OSI96109.1 hypothetical protein BSZ24_05655 [Bradyrhizobium canariense]OSJ02064.1 hypothetical protein BSZ16_18885 [Bradyrhizobium canariense]OSJ17206.1 hypothetical protein BSZ18_04805 [Bradyrhizobium canariense]
MIHQLVIAGSKMATARCFGGTSGGPGASGASPGTTGSFPVRSADQKLWLVDDRMPDARQIRTAITSAASPLRTAETRLKAATKTDPA